MTSEEFIGQLPTALVHMLKMANKPSTDWDYDIELKCEHIGKKDSKGAEIVKVTGFKLYKAGTREEVDWREILR
jgi:hypothetical protein